MLHSSTSAAISTPPGKGGVAVIRISGPDAFLVAQKMFRKKGGNDGGEIRYRTQIYGDILYLGEEIDDGLITYFKAPNSYTGEDIVEISCHGGVLITKKVLESALAEGAVLAGPGEFTKRAFVSGKISLTDTEAISMLLDAKSDAQIKLSRGQARSKLNTAVEEIRGKLVELLSSIYARIDYPDEDLGEFTDEEILESLRAIDKKMEMLEVTYKTGKAISVGIPTVICGKPNVGKSTLYNLLVGEEAAIVTDIPGTTRDVLERTVSSGNVLLKLYDTAGIREGELDAVEEIGISRSIEKMEGAELVLALFDSSRPFDEEDKKLVKALERSEAVKIVIITKCDKNANNSLQSENGFCKNIKDELGSVKFDDVLEISALCDSERARELVFSKIERVFINEDIAIGEDAIISSARQNASLIRARAFLKTAIDAFSIGLECDAASTDIELSLGAIAELDGRSVTEEIVNDIFSKFCVGK